MKDTTMMVTKAVRMVALIVVLVAGGYSVAQEQAAGGEAGHSESGGEGCGSGEAGESGSYYALDATFDEVQSGARLILNYDAQTGTFLGTVENTTDTMLSQVRVEVHLDGGVELGPTVATDLEPGQVLDVSLEVTGTNFTTWTAHPEVGNSAEGGEAGEVGHSESGGEGCSEVGGGGEHSDGSEGGEHSEGGEQGDDEQGDDEQGDDEQGDDEQGDDD